MNPEHIAHSSSLLSRDISLCLQCLHFLHLTKSMCRKLSFSFSFSFKRTFLGQSLSITVLLISRGSFPFQDFCCLLPFRFCDRHFGKWANVVQVLRSSRLYSVSETSDFYSVPTGSNHCFMKESLRNVGFYSVSTGSNHCFMIKSLRNVGFCSVSTGSNHCFMIKSLRNVGFYSLSNDTDQSMMTRRERERV